MANIPFTAELVDGSAFGFGTVLRFSRPPAKVLSDQLKAAGFKYQKGVGYPLGSTAAGRKLGESIVQQVAAYMASKVAQAAQVAGLVTPVPEKVASTGRGRKVAKHRNLEQLLGQKLTKAQFEAIVAQGVTLK